MLSLSTANAGLPAPRRSGRHQGRPTADGRGVAAPGRSGRRRPHSRAALRSALVRRPCWPPAGLPPSPHCRPVRLTAGVAVRTGRQRWVGGRSHRSPPNPPQSQSERRAEYGSRTASRPAACPLPPGRHLTFRSVLLLGLAAILVHDPRPRPELQRLRRCRGISRGREPGEATAGTLSLSLDNPPRTTHRPSASAVTTRPASW